MNRDDKHKGDLMTDDRQEASSTMTRRSALGAIAAATMGSVVVATEAQQRSRLGLVAFNCAIRRQWMQQQDPHFDLFCGPVPLRPHHRHLWMKEDFKVGDLLWRGWDLFRDYSGHLMTNSGAHTVDMVQLALGRDETGPVEVRAVEPNSVADLWPHWKSKTPAPVGDSATSTSDRRFWPVTMKYADGIELHFTSWDSTHAGSLKNGPDFIVFHGEKGRL